MGAQVCFDATHPSHVGAIRRSAVRMAQASGLTDARANDAAIVASELATNLVKHAQSGRMWLQPIRSARGGSVEIIAVDSGPGIADLHRSLQDGYSTAGTAGTGFGAVRRLSDDFDAFSTVGRGTVVLSRLHARDANGQSPFTFGAVSLPAPHEEVCGDSWRIAEQGGAFALMVADGLGHGPLAMEAAERAAGVFESRPFVEARDFYDHAHRSLHGSRGAALARAVVDASGRIDFSGIGNIASTLVGIDGSRGLPSQNGTVGAEMRRNVASATYDWPSRGILLMHSDGIASRWSLDPYPGLLVRHPALIAATLFRDFVRGRDDATVVVVSRRTGPGAP